MPLAGQWWLFRTNVIAFEKDLPGVYELGDADGTVVYIGSSNELRRRLQEHLDEDPRSCIQQRVHQYRVEYTTEYHARERDLYHACVVVHGRAPICNQIRAISPAAWSPTTS